MKKIKSFLIVAAACFVNSVFSQEIKFKYDEKTQFYGFVDSNDNYVVNPIYTRVDINFGFRESGLYKVVDLNDKIGFVDERGEIVVACKYDYSESYEKGHAVVAVTNSENYFLYGMIDSLGKEVIQLKYGYIEYYSNDGVLVFGKENSFDLGLMNLKGQVLIPEQYAIGSAKVTNGLWPVTKGGKSGVVNLKNEIVVPFEYRIIESFSDSLGIAAAQKENYGKYGFIDRKGKVVIPFEYENAYSDNKYLAVSKNKKWGLIDINNNIILPLEYYGILTFKENSVWVVKNKGEERFEVDLITIQKVFRIKKVELNINNSKIQNHLIQFPRRQSHHICV